MNSKILTLLGFAAKANKLSYGLNIAKESIKSKKAKLVIVSFEVSEKSQKEINYFCKHYETEILVLNNCTMETLSRAVGKKCGILSVNDLGFAEAITKEEMLNDK